MIYSSLVTILGYSPFSCNITIRIQKIVALISYGGETTKCCKESILAASYGGGGNVKWDEIIFGFTFFYLVLIILEVIPVVTDRFPFNLFNPLIGFLITLSVFFSDSMSEAIIMLILEIMVVGCEVFIYWMRRKRYLDRKGKLNNTKKEIEKLRKLKRKVKDHFETGNLSRNSSDDNIINVELSDDDSISESDSFADELEKQGGSSEMSHTGLTTVTDIGQVRENRLLRERRQLRSSAGEYERDLQYHLAGVSLNVTLVLISLCMITIFSTNRGVCIKDMSYGNPFQTGQFEKCNICGEKGLSQNEDCEVCIWKDPKEQILEESQCYYAYGSKKQE